MANFAFIYTPSEEWLGGRNYYISAILNLSLDIDNQEGLVYVFTDSKTDTNQFDKLKNVIVVRTNLLSKAIPKRFFARGVDFLFGENTNLYFLMKYYKIDILSHSYLPSWTGVKSVPWIPDFQHCHLPSFFSDKQIKYRNKKFTKYLQHDYVLLSSFSALKDAKTFYNLKAKPLIYKFPPIESHEEEGNLKACRDLNIVKPYVFLPNQFWPHKNHAVVLEACKLAKEKNIEFKIFCTGYVEKGKHSKYIFDYIDKYKLHDYIEILGLVDRSVFECLMMNSKALLNPSLFEGWSTSVEEGIANNKVMILSNIDVHKEQTCELSSSIFYFSEKCPHELLENIVMALSFEEKPNYKNRPESARLSELIGFIC